jgi:hypothetical protein
MTHIPSFGGASHADGMSVEERIRQIIWWAFLQRKLLVTVISYLVLLHNNKNILTTLWIKRFPLMKV